jgi:two-component system cell cycle response regulator DivK
MTAQILIVEDNVDSREILRDLLTSVGYAVLEATTGSQGICAAVTHGPDLILMDLHLPGMDGYEATRRIKAHPALGHIPIIAVTAYALSGDDVKALAAGCDGYVARPFDPCTLLATLRTYVT